MLTAFRSSLHLDEKSIVPKLGLSVKFDPHGVVRHRHAVNEIPIHSTDYTLIGEVVANTHVEVPYIDRDEVDLKMAAEVACSEVPNAE